LLRDVAPLYTLGRVNADAAGTVRPEVVEDQVSRAMEVARRRAGLTTEEMARRLRPVLRLPDMPRHKQARSNWYGWRQNPRSIPAVALVAAARLAGTTVDALLSDATPVPAAGRLTDLEREVAELRQLAGQMQAALGEVRIRVGLPWAPTEDADEEASSEGPLQADAPRAGPNDG
jgi:hypothetical protein